MADYVADLEKRGRAGRKGRGAKLLKSRIKTVLREAGWSWLGQISADGFIEWRNRQSVGARTLNHYLEGMVSFMNWLERVGRVQTNPLRLVAKVDERGQRKRVRRAFTDEELAKLVAGSGPRGIIYLTAARTGLRQEELRQLCWGDLHLDAAHPFVLAQASTTKNKKEEPLPLLPELVEALRKHRPAHCGPTDRVFPRGIPRASRLKVDAERNGIAYRDAQGRYADFHALRYTWDTFLNKNGVEPRLVMKLMRHSDPKLSMKTYLDERQLPVREAVERLPRLRSPEEYTQIRAQISGPEGQNVARVVASDKKAGPQKSSVNTGVLSGFSPEVVSEEMERAKGFEPSTFTLAR